MVADMFLHWVYGEGRGPNDADKDSYRFLTDSPNSVDRQIAWTLEQFTFGTTPPAGVNVQSPSGYVYTPQDSGMAYWIKKAKRENTN